MPPSATAFPCCRDHDLFAPVEEYPQCIQRTPGDEAYWFGWDSSFDGKATILIARIARSSLQKRCRSGSAGSGRASEACIACVKKVCGSMC